MTMRLRNFYEQRRTRRLGGAKGNGTEHELVEKARDCAGKLRSILEAEDALKAVRKYDRRSYRRRRWSAWLRLTDIHQTCLNQLRELGDAKLLFTDLSVGRVSGDDGEAFLRSFHQALAAPRAPEDELDYSAESIRHVLREIKTAERTWTNARQGVEKNIPDMFLTHAFFVAAQATGLEVVSLFVGVLVLLGLLFTSTFYWAAVDSWILPYVTLEDFVDEGVRSLILAGAFLAVVEGIFWMGWKRGRWSKGEKALAPHRAIVRRPARTALALFLGIAAVVGTGGYTYGVYKQWRFFHMEQGQLEVATALDGTVLRDVYLVGTTARTASFLQACSWDNREVGFLGSGELSSSCRRTGAKQGERIRVGRVVVMDRALLVCHAKGEACLDQGPTRASSRRWPPG